MRLFSLEAEPELEVEKLARQKDEHVVPDIVTEIKDEEEKAASAAAAETAAAETPPVESDSKTDSEDKEEVKEEKEDTSDKADDKEVNEADEADVKSTESLKLCLESTVNDIKGMVLVHIVPGERVTGDSEEEPVKETAVETKEPVDDIELSYEQRLIKSMETSSYIHVPEIISTESLRNSLRNEMTSLTSSRTVSMEEWSEVSSGSVLKNIAGTVGTTLLQLGKYLGTTVAPIVLKATYKGVVYAFLALLRGMTLGASFLEKYLKRRWYSFNNLKSRIQKAEHALDLIEKAHGRLQHAEGRGFTASRIINQIASGPSINLKVNVSVLDKFVNESIKGLGNSIRRDILAIQQIITQSSSRVDANISALLEMTPPLSGLHEAHLADLENKTAKLTNYVYPMLLPGTVVLTMSLPSQGEKTYEEWVEAYKASDIFLLVDRSRFETHGSIPYMELKDLKELLIALNKLCIVSIDHQKFYESIKQDKIKLKAVYRKYFDALVSSKVRVTTRQSMIDLVILRNNFLDKVYLPAAIDIHDHVARTVNSYLSYIEKNIKTLSP